MDARIAQLNRLMEQILGCDPGVKAVFLNGSQVTGEAGPGSNVDYTVLAKHAECVEDVDRLLGQFLRPLGHAHGVPEYEFGGVRVSVSIFPRSAADGWIDQAFVSGEDLLDCQGVLQHKFVEAQAIYDPDGVLAEYRRRLGDYPDFVAQEIVNSRTAYLQEEYLDDWGFRGVFHYCYCLADMLEHIAQAIYARNKRFYMPPLKRLHHDLQSLEPNISGELTTLVTVTPDDDYEPKRAALESIVSRLRSN